MGSSENQNQFKPYYINDRDCSLGICTKYCPQFCYIAFPPPPQDGSSSPFTPSIVTTIVVLAGAFLLALSYYLIITRYCKNRRRRTSSPTIFQQQAEMASTTTNNQSQAATSSPSGLDETLIKTIAVCKYRKGDGLIEGTDCAVCLNEFEEDESLRLLPKCGHAFHLPCIDAWLRSHSNCPLCRAGVVVSSRRSTDQNACEIHLRPPDDLVLLVVDEDVRVLSVVVSEGNDDDDVSAKSPVLDRGIEGDRESASKFKRSVSLGAFCSDDRTVKIEQVRQDYDECSSSSMSTMKRSASSEGYYIFTADNM